MKILVTRGRGQLGREIASLLSAADVDYAAPGKEDLDVTDANAVAAFGRSAGFSAVIHAAAYTRVDAAETEPQTAYAINEAASANVAKLCAEMDVPLVYVSTDFV